LAVKIVRQPKKIALIGAPSSAAALLPGTEKAPAALRAAGLVERLHQAGYEVTDFGDCPQRLFADDDEHRRARNLPPIVAGLNDLKMHVEVATKSGAFVLVLGGDCAQSIGLITGSRRYYKHVNLLWFDRDADLNTPASTPSGRIDGMVVAHIIGKGAPELVRFWGEPPLVREPDITLFGLERLDPPEQELLAKSPVRHMMASGIQAKGAAASAKNALTQLHADSREFVLHLDLDAIAQEDLGAVNVPGSGGLRFDDVQAALTAFVSHKNLLGFDVAQFNPDRDPDGSGARKVVDLLVEALTTRINTASSPESVAPEVTTPSATSVLETTASAPAFEPPSTGLPVSEPPASDAETHAEASVDSSIVAPEAATPQADLGTSADAESESEGDHDSRPENARGATSFES
jgi:arginase